MLDLMENMLTVSMAPGLTLSMSMLPIGTGG